MLFQRSTSNILINNKIKKNHKKIHKKIGVVITTHGYNGIYVIQCIECYLRHIPDTYIVLFVNESSDPMILNIKDNFPTIEYIYIHNQNKFGGLTATWNSGINLCIKNNCSIVILSNDDIFFDNTINYIIYDALNCSNNDMKYFGPITNNPGPTISNKFLQYGLHALNKQSYEAIYNKKKHNINGFSYTCINKK